MPLAKFLVRAAQCKRIQYALAAVCLTLAAPAQAHDFWIEPLLTFRASPGATVALQLLVGQDFKGNSVLYLPEQFERYVVANAGAEQPVAGKRGDDPAGSVVLGSGLNVVGFYSKKFEVTFDSFEEFETYLIKEGLERNRDLARKRFSIRSGILERYTRCAKALLATPQATADKADHVFGFPLELVAETNPYRQNDLRLQLLYRGKPLQDALVIAFNKRNPVEKIKQRTDKDGRVALKLAQRGTWLVTSVHMIPAPLLSRADWESFWASLTFELP